MLHFKRTVKIIKRSFYILIYLKSSHVLKKFGSAVLEFFLNNSFSINNKISQIIFLEFLKFCNWFFIFSVHETHAIIKQDKKSHQVFIKPSEKDCRLLVNGDLITSEVYYLLITSMVFSCTI